jgi:hypothetical protein
MESTRQQFFEFKNYLINIKDQNALLEFEWTKKTYMKGKTCLWAYELLFSNAKGKNIFLLFSK